MIKLVDINDYEHETSFLNNSLSYSQIPFNYQIQMIDILELENLIYICIVTNENHIIIKKLIDNIIDSQFNYLKKIQIDQSNLNWRFENKEWDLYGKGEMKQLDGIQPFKLEALKLVLLDRKDQIYLANVVGSSYGILLVNFVQFEDEVFRYMDYTWRIHSNTILDMKYNEYFNNVVAILTYDCVYLVHLINQTILNIIYVQSYIPTNIQDFYFETDHFIVVFQFGQTFLGLLDQQFIDLVSKCDSANNKQIRFEISYEENEVMKQSSRWQLLQYSQENQLYEVQKYCFNNNRVIKIYYPSYVEDIQQPIVKNNVQILDYTLILAQLKKTDLTTIQLHSQLCIVKSMNINLDQSGDTGTEYHIGDYGNHLIIQNEIKGFVLVIDKNTLTYHSKITPTQIQNILKFDPKSSIEVSKLINQDRFIVKTAQCIYLI